MPCGHQRSRLSEAWDVGRQFTLLHESHIPSVSASLYSPQGKYCVGAYRYSNAKTSSDTLHMRVNIHAVHLCKDRQITFYKSHCIFSPFRLAKNSISSSWPYFTVSHCTRVLVPQHQYVLHTLLLLSGGFRMATPPFNVWYQLGRLSVVDHG